MELLKYFYHPDHLGSSSWITDGSGQAIQHLHYLPFGEDWVDQRNSSWNSPYTFSGKEKDIETGYGYFGARYYDSGLSIWLSVDPMSDKYPNMFPYNYCANNPVIIVDPDGRECVDNEGGPDGPMGKGDGPSENQIRNKPLPTRWQSPGVDNVNKMSFDNSIPQTNNSNKTNNPLVSTTSSVTHEKTVDESAVARISLYTSTTTGNAGYINIDQNVTTSERQFEHPSMELQTRYTENIGVTMSKNGVGAFVGPFNIKAGFNFFTGDFSIGMGYSKNSKTNGFRYDIKPTGSLMLLMIFVPSVLPFPATTSAVPVPAPSQIPDFIFIK